MKYFLEVAVVVVVVAVVAVAVMCLLCNDVRNVLESSSNLKPRSHFHFSGMV